MLYLKPTELLTNLTERWPFQLGPLRGPKVEDYDWSSPSVVHATATHDPTVAAWLTPEDVRSKKKSLTQVASWREDAVAALVLMLARTDGTRVPVGFAALSEYGPNARDELEVTALVIRPELRRRGLGSALLRHLATSVHGEVPPQHNLTVFVRCARGNEAGRALIEGLPFDLASPPPWAQPDDVAELAWYQYRATPRPADLGGEVRRLRSIFNLTQGDLAFRVGVSPATINMIESNSRRPSIELLQSLSLVLGRTQADRITLALAALGEKPEPIFRNLSALVPNAAERTTLHRPTWIIADAFEETASLAKRAQARAAIVAGVERRYLAPPGHWTPTRIASFVRFLTDDDPALVNRVKLYSAPDVLCALRLEITAPESLHPVVTAEGIGKTRTTLSPERADMLVPLVSGGIIDADARADRDEEDPNAQFVRMYPRGRKVVHRGKQTETRGARARA